MQTFAEKPKLIQRITSPKSRTPHRAHAGQSYAVNSILHSQRMAGQRPIGTNNGVANDVSTLGLKQGVEDNEILRGRTTDEIILDLVRPVGTALENALISDAGASAGVRVATTTKKGPAWKKHGVFEWHVDFKTTGRSGWIVQEIFNTWRAKDAAGKAVASSLTPHYLEAWAVDSAGKVTPKQSSSATKVAANDYWDTPNLKVYYRAVEGHSATTAKVYFTKTNPATQGFIRNNPATNAPGLLTSTTTPAGLGKVRLYRYAQSTWDSTKAVPTHFGSAGP